jgi:hypothetical protein
MAFRGARGGRGSNGGRGRSSPRHFQGRGQGKPPAAIEAASNKWTPGVSTGGVRALYAKSDGSLDPNELQLFFDSIIAYIGANFPREYRHLADTRRPVHTTWPTVEGIKPLPPRPPPPEPFVDVRRPTIEELRARTEHETSIDVWKAELSELTKYNTKRRNESEDQREALYSFIHGQLHPKVLAVLRLTEAGNSAQQAQNLDALRLIEALRSMAHGKLKAGAESQWREARRTYENYQQGDTPLQVYYERFKVFRANYITAGQYEQEAREQEARLTAIEEHDDDNEADAASVRSTHSVAIEEDQDSIIRFVEGLNPRSSIAYRTIIEQNTVADFRREFLDPDLTRALQFRRKYCSTLDATLAFLQESIRNRSENPTSADLTYLRTSKMANIQGAYAATTKTTTTGSTDKLGATATTDSAKKRAGPDKVKHPCSACGQPGHWYSEGKCEEGRKILPERAAAKAAAKNDD